MSGLIGCGNCAKMPVRAPSDVVNSLGMVFKRIPAGHGYVGSPSSEEGRYASCAGLLEGSRKNDSPDRFERLRLVSIKKPFYLGQTEVTNAQFRRFQSAHSTRIHTEAPEGNRVWQEHSVLLDADIERMGDRSINQDDQPVASVTCDQARAFCRWLSALPSERKAGRSYRLPTEEEWEYACRAGTQTRFFWGQVKTHVHKFANVADASGKAFWPWKPTFDENDGAIVSSPVAQFKPNPFGLYDMLGNVYEMCSDDVHPFQTTDLDPKQTVSIYPGTAVHPSAALRGGSWLSKWQMVRCAARFPIACDTPGTDVGFRVVLVQGEPGEKKGDRRATSCETQPTNRRSSLSDANGSTTALRGIRWLKGQ